MTGKRDLIAARLSNDTDASTSVERQIEACLAKSKSDGGTVVAITKDVDVSGAVSPFERPDLGPWLNGKSDQWNRLIVHKLDRISRSVVDFGILVAWCQSHGKTLVVLDPMIDLSTAWGQAMANVLMTFAQLERQMIGLRVADSRRKTRSNGHWAGGQGIPDGYRAVKVDSHHELAIDERRGHVIEYLARMIIGGSSIRGACRALNDAGYRAAKGGLWDAASVSAMLRNPALRGYVMHDGVPVADPDGMPVRRDAVLDDETWTALQAALARLARKDSGIRHGGSLLLGVLTEQRGLPLYMHRRPGHGDRYRTATKDGIKSASFSAPAIEGLLSDALLRHLGDMPMRRREIIPGNDSARQRDLISQRLADLENQAVDGKISGEAFGRMESVLRARLASLPAAAPDRAEWVPTGGTFAAHWAGLDDNERHAALLRWGVKATVLRGESGDAYPAALLTPGTPGSVIQASGSRLTLRVRLGALTELRDLAAAD